MAKEEIWLRVTLLLQEAIHLIDDEREGIISFDLCISGLKRIQRDIDALKEIYGKNG